MVALRLARQCLPLSTQSGSQFVKQRTRCSLGFESLSGGTENPIPGAASEIIDYNYSKRCDHWPEQESAAAVADNAVFC